MIKKLTQLDAGVYTDMVRANRTSLSEHLDALAAAGDIDPGFLPTPQERKAAAGGREITALQHIFAAHGIRTKGERASKGGVFTRGDSHYVEGAEVLFPAFVTESYQTPDIPFRDVQEPQRWIDQSQRQPRNRVTLADLVSANVGIDGDTYKAGVIERGAEDDLDPARVTEGADLPLYIIKTAEHSIKVYKYGGRVRASYEYLRRTSLNLVGRTIAGISRREEVRKVRAAIAVALNGDGNSNPAINVNNGNAAAWRVTDFDIIEAEMNDYDREPAVYVADKATLLAIRALRIPASGIALTPAQAAMYGNPYMTPSGVPLKFAPTSSILDGSNKLLTLGIGDGLDQVTENGSIIQEADRFIANQTQEFTISENVGFAKSEPHSFFTITKAN
ncbi:MAG: hypothetical protein WCY60_01825 [Trueperaceae bacterium]